MEAKDTIMTRLWAGEGKEASKQITNLLKQQAEITWKAREPEIVEARKVGRKEVVDLLKLFNPRVGDLDKGFAFLLDTPLWQAKLKEWE